MIIRSIGLVLGYFLDFPLVHFVQQLCPYLFLDTTSLFQLCKLQGCCFLRLKCSYCRPSHGCSFTFSGLVFIITVAEKLPLHGGATATVSTLLFFVPLSSIIFLPNLMHFFMFTFYSMYFALDFKLCEGQHWSVLSTLKIQTLTKKLSNE